jgi:hypothetical protein
MSRRFAASTEGDLPMLTALLLAAALAAAPLTTVAERSGFVRTGRYAEVLELCRAFERAHRGKVRCVRFGETGEGRPLVALVASSDGALTAPLAHRRGRPVVLWQGGIHAGEIDGKDAGFWLLRELLEGKPGRHLLAKVTVVFVPVINPDGHERFGPNNRPNQVGPKEMGWRVNAQNLNLNRDYTKLDSLELRALMGLLLEWDPILYLDLHVTDGAKFRHPVAVMLEPQHTGPQRLRQQGQKLGAALLAELEAKGHHPLPFYPSFRTADDPKSGFAYGIAPPRFGYGYWPLRNRFAILVETHSWKDYATRVRATRSVLEATLAQAAQAGPEWLLAARAADQADRDGEGGEVTLRWTSHGEPQTLDFLGYAYTQVQSEVSGQRWIRYDEQTPEVWKVPLWTHVRPERTAPVPQAYLVPKAHAGWVAERLRLHGLGFQTLLGDQFLEVEVFRAKEAKFRPAPYEGRQPATLEGDWSPEKRQVPAGTLRVPTAQRGRALVVHLFEPQAPDSFVSWGQFNAAFEQKEYLEDYVVEVAAREMMAKDAGLKELFWAKVEKDPAFAQSPAARLRFFAERHPAWDERLNLYPVLREPTRAP